jgi:hypothetical protein
VLGVRRGEAPDAELRIVTDPNTLAGLLRGDRSWEAEREVGHVAVTGECVAAHTFLGFFGAAAVEKSN